MHLKEAVDYNYKINQAQSMPSIYAIIDYGYEGEKYKFTNKDDFFLGSVVLKWDLFTGFQNNAKRQNSQIEKHKMLLKEEEVKQQIGLDVRRAYYNNLEKLQSKKAASSQLIESEKSYRITEKRFAEGMATQIELIDARTNYTSASVNKIISSYDYLISMIDIDLASGLIN